MEASTILHAFHHTAVNSLGVFKGVLGMGNEKSWRLTKLTVTPLWSVQLVPRGIGWPDRRQHHSYASVLAEDYFANYIESLWDMKHGLWIKDGEIEDGAEGLRIVCPDNDSVAAFGRDIITIKAAYRRGKLISNHGIRTTLYSAPYIIAALLAGMSDLNPESEFDERNPYTHSIFVGFKFRWLNILSTA
ncbi:hypothetical protein BP6252_00035 [Coleophoma cylindrospora]|uniref:Uncharacterized protein n=1 Tax=Coleophoma cylindrospora TaxID=1849047 RepID=A0A3D8SNU4_9HELO|nr:hypothetical protein BP6252_00035 [Coleophoma cylindrospora]